MVIIIASRRGVCKYQLCSEYSRMLMVSNYSKIMLSIFSIGLVPSDKFNLVMSSIYIRNKGGPNIDPWGTPDATLNGLEVCPFTATPVYPLPSSYEPSL